MIAIVTGKLGSGKTYFTVNYILKKFYRYEEPILQYVPLSTVRIITNIRGFRLPHENLQDLICNDAGLPDMAKMRMVFSPEFVQGEKNVIFVIDEAQSIFPRKFYDVQIFTFFQKARQEGLDIFLITQDVNTLAKEFVVLCEYEINALQRAKRSKNVFVYKYLLVSEGRPEVFKTVSLKFRMDIASVYTSFVKTEKEKLTFVYKRYLFLAGLALVAALVILRFAIGTFFGFKGDSGKTHAKKNDSAVTIVDPKAHNEEMKKLFGKAYEKVAAEKEAILEKGGPSNVTNTSGEDGTTNAVSGISTSPQMPAQNQNIEIGTAGPFVGRVVSIKYDDPLINIVPEGGADSGGGCVGSGSDGSSGGFSGSTPIVHGPGLAPSYHGYSGPWVWHPPSEWVVTENRFELVDYRGRVIGYIRGPESSRIPASALSGEHKGGGAR
jgi:hypothetical protein